MTLLRRIVLLVCCCASLASVQTSARAAEPLPADRIVARVDAWLPDGTPNDVAPFCKWCGEPVERRPNPDTGAPDWIHLDGMWGCDDGADGGAFAEVEEKAILDSLPPCNCGSIDKNGGDIGEHASTCLYHLAAVRIFGETR